MAVNRSKEVAGSQEWAKWKASGAVGTMETAERRSLPIIHLIQEASSLGEMFDRREQTNAAFAERGLVLGTTMVHARTGRVIDLWFPGDSTPEQRSEAVGPLLKRMRLRVVGDHSSELQPEQSTAIVSSQSKIPQPPSAL